MIPFVRIEICWDEIKDVKVKDGKGTKGRTGAGGWHRRWWPFVFALSLVIVFTYCVLPTRMEAESKPFDCVYLILSMFDCCFLGVGLLASAVLSWSRLVHVTPTSHCMNTYSVSGVWLC